MPPRNKITLRKNNEVETPSTVEVPATIEVPASAPVEIPAPVVKQESPTLPVSFPLSLPYQSPRAEYWVLPTRQVVMVGEHAEGRIEVVKTRDGSPVELISLGTGEKYKKSDCSLLTL